MSVKNIASKPYVGFARLAIGRIDKDTKEAYTANTNVAEFVDGAVSMSFNISASETAFYSSNKKTASDYTFSPTASIAYAGDNEEIDQILFGKVSKGGAVMENLGTAPECFALGLMNTADGWVIRQILKFTAAKDDVAISTKGESVSFTNPSASLSCMASTYFQAYTRDFYSTNEAFADMTADEVFDALLADPSKTFGDDVGV